MRATVLKYGIIGGGVLVLFMYLTLPFMGKQIDFDQGQWIGYITMIIALSTVFFGTKAFRDKQLAGVISFGKALQIGVLIALVASTIYVANWMLYLNTAGKGFMDSYYRYTVEKLESSGQPETEIQARIADMEKFRELYKNPMVQIGLTYLEIVPVGLAISLLSAAILRRRRE